MRRSKDGLRFVQFYFGLPLAMIVLAAVAVPAYQRLRVFTAYEYLERRFDGRTRTLTSLLFLLSRGLAVGVTLYALSLVLSVVLGWSEAATIALMGGTPIVYVVYGGNRSVIWTDVVQMALIWFGIFVCVGVAIARLPAEVGLRDALALAQTAGRLETVDLSFDLTRPYTLWSGLIGGMFLAMAYFRMKNIQTTAMKMIGPQVKKKFTYHGFWSAGLTVVFTLRALRLL